MITCNIFLSVLMIFSSLWYMRQFFRLLPKAIYYHLVFIAALLFYSGTGVFLAYTALTGREMERLLRSSRADHPHVLYAMVLALSFALFVYWLGNKLSGSITTPTLPLVKTIKDMSQNTRQFVGISLLLFSLYGFLIATHKIGLEGIQVSVTDAHVDPLALICQPLIFIMPVLCGYRLFAKGNLWLTVPVFLISTALVLIQGRRLLTVLLFLCLLGVMMNRDIKSKLSARLTLLVMAGCFAVFGFIAFYALRMAFIQTGSTDLGVVTTRAYELMTTDDQKSKNDVVGQSKKNIDTRAFGPIGYLARVTNSKPWLYAGGGVLENAFVNSIPSAFFPNKLDYAKDAIEETITYNALELDGPNKDSANTVLSAGYSDFREIGLLIYGFLLVMTFVAILQIARRTATPLLRTSMITTVLLASMNVEATTGYWFVTLRGVLLLFMIDFFLRIFLNRAPSNVPVGMRASLPQPGNQTLPQ